MLRVAFCVSGQGSLFRAAVRNRQELQIHPVLLVTESKAAADLSDFARESGITHVRLDQRTRSEFHDALSKALHSATPDLVSLTFDRILPPHTVQAFSGRIINVHPSLLPAFAGRDGIERTLRSGVSFGGATIHEVTVELDAGPIVAQAVFATARGEATEDFGRRMYAVLEPMYLAVLRWYAEGRVHHDEAGRVIVRGATYGRLPISPWED